MKAAGKHAIIKQAALQYLGIDIDIMHVVELEGDTLHALIGTVSQGGSDWEIIDTELYENEESGHNIRLGYGPRAQLLVFRFVD